MAWPTAVVWFREEDYERARALMALPATFAEWLAATVEHRDGLRAWGLTVEEVTVDLDEFLAWCAAEGRTPDGPACHRFADLKVRR